MDVSILVNATRKSLSRNIFLLVLIAGIYAFENFSPEAIRNDQIVTYFIKPAIWIVIVLVILCLPSARPSGKLRLRGMLRWMAFIIACIYIFVMMLGGIARGFGKSPFDHSLTGIVTNIVYISSTLVGREMIRNHLVNNHKSKRRYLIISMVTVVMTLSSLPINALGNIKTRLDIVSYIGGTFLPEFSNNILASYLVYLGGPIISIIYLGIVQSFYWLFPILPNLNWVTKALIGTLCPIFALMFLQYFYSTEAGLVKGDKNDENPLGWILTSVISIAVVWFSVGVFPVRPYVIVTGSMEPVIRAGDMVIIRKMSADDIVLGDVIQYKREGAFIFHRVIEIVRDRKSGFLYRAKGDNNTIPDLDLIKPEDIYGKVVYTIPKIGWPTMILKSGGEEEKGKYEY